MITKYEELYKNNLTKHKGTTAIVITTIIGFTLLVAGVDEVEETEASFTVVGMTCPATIRIGSTSTASSNNSNYHHHHEYNHHTVW